MKQTFTMYVYKKDRRCKSGERLFSTSVWQDRTLEGMEREMQQIARELYPGTDWRFELVPTCNSSTEL